MDKLEEDAFGTSDWIDAKLKNYVDLRQLAELPADITEVAEELINMCAARGIPVFTAFSISDKVEVRSNIGDKPENCHINFMLARATAVGKPAYVQNMVMNPAFLAHVPRNNF